MRRRWQTVVPTGNARMLCREFDVAAVRARPARCRITMIHLIPATPPEAAAHTVGTCSRADFLSHRHPTMPLHECERMQLDKRSLCTSGSWPI